MGADPDSRRVAARNPEPDRQRSPRQTEGGVRWRTRGREVAVVEEVKDKFQTADAVIITEYRGLTVRDLQDLRTCCARPVASTTCTRTPGQAWATASLDLELDEHLLGPTALTFVGSKADGTPGDVVTVAKASSRSPSPTRCWSAKGGVLGDSLFDQAALSRLAEVAPGGAARSVSPVAWLRPCRTSPACSTHPQKMAYALQALIEAGGASDAPAPVADEPTEPAADEAATQEPTAEADPADTAEAEGCRQRPTHRPTPKIRTRPRRGRGRGRG